ncbi:hypothetical protein [Sphingobacterium kyonggiense]
MQLQFDHQALEGKNYIRTLDIRQAVSTITYEVNGVKFEDQLLSAILRKH